MLGLRPPAQPEDVWLLKTHRRRTRYSHNMFSNIRSRRFFHTKTKQINAQIPSFLGRITLHMCHGTWIAWIAWGHQQGSNTQISGQIIYIIFHQPELRPFGDNVPYYPLVNVYIAMENHNFYYVNQL